VDIAFRIGDLARIGWVGRRALLNLTDNLTDA